MSSKRTIGTVVTLIGVVQLAISAGMNGWLQSVFINTGTATLLFVPLFLIQQQLTRRVETTESSVNDLGAELRAAQSGLTQSLTELRSEFENSELQRQKQVDEHVAQLGHIASRDTLIAVIDAAIAERVVSAKWGLRSHLIADGADIFGRVTRSDGSLTVTIERRSGEAVASFEWGGDASPINFVKMLAEQLLASSLMPSSFDASFFFQQISKDISKARSAKFRYAMVDDMSEIQQVMNGQWFICDWGIFGISEAADPYWIGTERLQEADWYQHMNGKRWVDISEFEWCLDTAILLRDAGRLKSLEN